MEKDYKFIPIRYDYSDFELFLKFLPTVEYNTFVSKIDRHNPHINTSDVYLWKDSLKIKFIAVKLLYEEVLHQIPIWKNDIALTKERGFNDDTSQLILLIKYETFLNTIYNLCETLSHLVRKFLRKANLPTGFHAQKQTKYANIIKCVDETYLEILDRVDWYNEVQSYRTEATHYLSGFIFISDTGEPGYLNKPNSDRQGAPENISIDNIKQHVIELYDKVCSFILEFSRHFLLTKCIKDQPIADICLRRADGGIGTRTITLSHYLSGRPPTCVALDFYCPHEGECEALDKPSGRKKSNDM